MLTWQLVVFVVACGFVAEVVGYVVGWRRGQLDARERADAEATRQIEESVRLYCEQLAHGPRPSGWHCHNGMLSLIHI